MPTEPLSSTFPRMGRQVRQSLTKSIVSPVNASLGMEGVPEEKRMDARIALETVEAVGTPSSMPSASIMARTEAAVEATEAASQASRALIECLTGRLVDRHPGNPWKKGEKRWGRPAIEAATAIMRSASGDRKYRIAVAFCPLLSIHLPQWGNPRSPERGSRVSSKGAAMSALEESTGSWASASGSAGASITTSSIFCVMVSAYTNSKPSTPKAKAQCRRARTTCSWATGLPQLKTPFAR